MREIRFRAWHKERNKMLDVFGINFRTPATAQVLNDEYNHYEELLSCVELMQFTGLKDCNGVDIYEGDIVHIDYFGYRPSPFNVDSFAGVVKLINGSFVVEKNSAIGDFLFQETALVKVLGNIHQNQELIGE